MPGKKWWNDSLIQLLNQKAAQYEHPAFIDNDPISVPHRFCKKQDIEIAGFITATISWGNRKSIIQNSMKCMQLMDNAPHDFILNHTDKDLKRFEGFVHRTFNATDLLYFIDALQRHYRQYDSLEDAFANKTSITVKEAFIHFHQSFFDVEYAPQRTRKHVPTPQRQSACKRLNMFLRWMVRPSSKGVDFGIWKKFNPSDLICPLDIHVQNVAREFGLLSRRQNDWQAAEELTASLRMLDAGDPVKYDFALFGMGVMERKTYRTDMPSLKQVRQRGS